MPDQMTQDCPKEGCPGTIERDEACNEWECSECGETYGAGAEPDLNPVVHAKLEARQEIKDAVRSTILEEMPGIIDATLGATRDMDDRLEIDRIADQVEASGNAVLEMRARKRQQIGQSKNVALLNAKLETGIDLTPDGYETPNLVRLIDPMDGSAVERDAVTGKILSGGKEIKVRESYFTAVDGFSAAFKKRVEDEDMGHAQAYEETCAAFKLDPCRKPTGYERALSEMPKTAKGGYLKGRDQARQVVDGMLLEERKIEGGRLLKEARGGSLTEESVGGEFSDEDLDALDPEK